jgi:2'-5' RNA ligase
VREQVRVTLPGALRDEVDAIRARWNPELVSGNPAHATVVYHDEATHPARLRERLHELVTGCGAFELEIGGSRRFRLPPGGVYLEVSDPSGAVDRIRRKVLEPPFAPRRHFALHVTLLHPRFASRLDAAWRELAALRLDRRFRVDGLDLMSGGRDGVSFAAFPFRGTFS